MDSKLSVVAKPTTNFLSSSLQNHNCMLRRQRQRRRPRVQISSSSSSSSLQASVPSSSLLPLIPKHDVWGNWAALTGTATAAQFLGTRTSVGKLLGPPVTAMALTFGLATVGILQPGGTPAASALQQLSLQLATPLILLGADLRDAVSRCGPLLLSFIFAACATIAGASLGWTLSGAALQAALGSHDALVIASALLAKNVGGGINYVAVCRSLNASPLAVAAGLCVDNIFALIYFPATSALASGRPDLESSPSSSPPPQRQDDDDSAKQGKSSETIVHDNDETSNKINSVISVERATTALFLSASLLWLGERLGGSAGALPLCTVLTVLFASNAPRRWLDPLQPAAECLGVTALYFFFATAGAPGLAVASSVRASLLPLCIFLTSLYAVHGLLLTAGHLWLGKDNHADNNGYGGGGSSTSSSNSPPSSLTKKKQSVLAAAFSAQRLLVASSAAIGGPATSVALAQAAGWKSLSVPSLLVGNIGYAVATFCGLAFFRLFA